MKVREAWDWQHESEADFAERDAEFWESIERDERATLRQIRANIYARFGSKSPPQNVLMPKGVKL